MANNTDAKKQTITLKQIIYATLDYDTFVSAFCDGKDNDTTLKIWKKMIENTNGEYEEEYDDVDDDIDNHLSAIETIKEDAEEDIE